MTNENDTQGGRIVFSNVSKNTDGIDFDQHVLTTLEQSDFIETDRVGPDEVVFWEVNPDEAPDAREEPSGKQPEVGNSS